MSQRQSGPHARAASACIGHIGQYALITLEQFLLRAVALSPLIYALVSGEFFGLRREYVLSAALLSALVLWTLLALPARLRMGAQLSGWFGAQINAGSWSDRLRDVRREPLSDSEHDDQLHFRISFSPARRFKPRRFFFV